MGLKQLHTWFFSTLVLITAALSSIEVRAAEKLRIAVAGGSITDTIYQLGAEELLIGVDTTSNYPAAAKALPQVGYVRRLSAEGLMSLSPSLILGEDDMGPPATLNQLAQLNVDIKKLPQANSAAEIIANVKSVARAIGREEDGLRFINNKLQPLADHLEQQRPQIKSPATAILVLTVSSGSPVVAGSATSGHAILTMAGAQNLATFEGWKPLSIEALLAMKPDFVIVTDRGAKAFAEHPLIKLGDHKHHVLEKDGMYILGFGPRTLQAANELMHIFHPEISLPASMPFKERAAD